MFFHPPVSGITILKQRSGSRTWFGIQNDSISVALQGFEEGNSDDAEKFVFFSYRSLHKLLDDGHGLNSRVISLSSSSSSNSLSPPAKIRLRRARTKLDLGESTVCAYWDEEASLWSPDGCSLVDEEEEYSVCECSHLTSFALLTSGGDGVAGSGERGDAGVAVTDLSGSATNNMTADLIAYLVASVLVIVLIIVVVQVNLIT